jgi:hypothetical protein
MIRRAYGNIGIVHKGDPTTDLILLNRLPAVIVEVEELGAPA